MSLDIQVRTIPVIEAEIWLRLDRFTLMTEVLGCKTDAERAELIDVSERHFSRIATRRVGETVIAKTLVGLGRHERDLRRHQLVPTFEELFEIRERAA